MVSRSIRLKVCSGFASVKPVPVTTLKLTHYRGARYPGPMRALPILFGAAMAFAQPATLVLRNGKIATMNPSAPIVQAMAVRGTKIAALGSDRDAAQWIGPGTRVIDLHGMLAIPGFIEGHGHFTSLG
jgi:hypothetical protein